MKVALINPPMRHTESFSVLGITVPPLGLAYMAAVLEEKGHSVSFYMSPKTIWRHLRKGRVSFFFKAAQLAFRRAF